MRTIPHCLLVLFTNLIISFTTSGMILNKRTNPQSRIVNACTPNIFARGGIEMIQTCIKIPIRREKTKYLFVNTPIEKWISFLNAS